MKTHSQFTKFQREEISNLVEIRISTIEGDWDSAFDFEKAVGADGLQALADRIALGNTWVTPAEFEYLAGEIRTQILHAERNGNHGKIRSLLVAMAKMQNNWQQNPSVNWEAFEKDECQESR